MDDTTPPAASPTEESEKMTAQESSTESDPTTELSATPAGAQTSTESPKESQTEGGGADKSKSKDGKTETSASVENAEKEKTEIPVAATSSRVVLSTSKKSRPPYKHDPNKITLRFLFANKDALFLTIECEPQETVGEVKGLLMSVWPKGQDLPDCTGGDRLRLICMGKGYLMPDTRTLKDCEIPTFETHPTPINVSVLPEAAKASANTPNKRGGKNNNYNAAGSGRGGSRRSSNSSSDPNEVSQGCSCNIM